MDERTRREYVLDDLQHMLEAVVQAHKQAQAASSLQVRACLCAYNMDCPRTRWP